MADQYDGQAVECIEQKIMKRLTNKELLDKLYLYRAFMMSKGLYEDDFNKWLSAVKKCEDCQKPIEKKEKYCYGCRRNHRNFMTVLVEDVI